MKSVLKRILSFTVLAVLLVNILAFSTMSGAGAAAVSVNYAAALQQSIYFYDAEKCGYTGASRLEWRGACHPSDEKLPLKPLAADGSGTNMSQAFITANKAVLDPDGDGTVDVHGGFHDAGDHVKFGLPQGYAASTLGWGFYEFRDAYKQTGQEAHMLEILRWFTDYFLRCTFRNSAGDVVAFCYQVGNGDSDHAYWGAPELQTTTRPGYFASPENPAGDQCGEAAAALAISYLNWKDSDPTYAAKCLDTAKALYAFGVKYRGLGFSGGYYGSAYDDDELAWGAIWLYIATGTTSYLNDIISVGSDGMYIGYLKKIIHSPGDDWQNIWVHSWDVVWGGVFAKLAPITNTTRDWYIFRWNIEYWAGITHENNPADTTFMAATPGGFKVVNTWGSARYNTAAQLCALVYNKYKPRTDFTNWAKGQMEYIFGNNPMNRCYEVGYSDISAKHPHHRAAHGSTINSMNDPVEHRHTLWGALVGGPDQKDVHNDVTTDYVSNEVAVDYNAAFVGALAGLYTNYGAGQQVLANFPPAEPPVTEYWSEAKVEQENVERTQVTIKVNNVSVHPPHTESAMKCRYYFNINELYPFAQSINDVQLAVMYDEQASLGEMKPIAYKGPFAWDNAGTYYVEFDWSGFAVYGKREIQFGLVVKQDANFLSHWDPTNDYSRQGLTSTAFAKTPNIPVYLGNTLVYGQEPIKATPSPTPTPTPSGGTPPPVTGNIQVLYQCAETGTPVGTIRPWFRIKNTGTNAINYSDVKIRYWFTKDSAEPLNFVCDASPAGATNTTGTFVTLATPVATADTYVDIGFAPGSGTLAAGATSTDLQVRIYKTGYTNSDQTNDYSFNTAMATAMGDNTKVTGYLGSTLKYGTEPGSVATATPTPTPSTATPTPSTATPTPTPSTATPTPTPSTATPTPTPSTATPTPTPSTATPTPTPSTATPTPTPSTATPTPTPSTATPTPTPTAGTPTPGGIKVQFFNGNTAATTNTVYPNFKLVNTGTAAINLSDVKMRYYFTNDGTAALSFACDFANAGAANVTSAFTTIARTNADRYCEVGFTSGAGTLAAGASTEVKCRIWKSDWSNFTQTNDYSFNATATNYVDSTTITGWIAGTLKWGTEP